MLLEAPSEPVKQVYFPDCGVVSVSATSAGKNIDVSMIGAEGMTGAAVLLADDRSPYSAYVQVAGSGHAIATPDLTSLIGTRQSLRETLLRYGHALTIQIAETARCNGRAKTVERVARLLLMTQDRLETQELSLTHDTIASMLGVRRPAVTDTLHILEGELAIYSRRGRVVIRDRQALETVAGGWYGVPEREYRRLFGARSPVLSAPEPHDSRGRRSLSTYAHNLPRLV